MALGKGFLVLHISASQLDRFPGYHDITGGGWVPGFSAHPPCGEFTVQVKDLHHSCAEGITDFVTYDELYYRLGWKAGNDVFLTADFEGEAHPLAWTRSYGEGRVLVFLLGHEGRSFETPEFQRLILAGLRWVGG